MPMRAEAVATALRVEPAALGIAERPIEPDNGG